MPPIKHEKNLSETAVIAGSLRIGGRDLVATSTVDTRDVRTLEIAAKCEGPLEVQKYKCNWLSGSLQKIV